MKKIVIIYFLLHFISCSGNSYKPHILSNTEQLISDVKSGNTELFSKHISSLNSDESAGFINTLINMEVNRIVVKSINDDGIVVVVVNINYKDINSDLYLQYKKIHNSWVLSETIFIKEKIMYIPSLNEDQSHI